MKRETWFTCFWSSVLSFLMGLGGAASMATGFGMPVSLSGLALGCGGIAAASALVWGLSRGWKIPAVWGLGWVLLFARSHVFREQAEAVLYELLSTYNKAYGWGLPGWLSAEMPETVVLPLMGLAALVSSAVCWTVCRGRPAWLAVPLGLLPLFTSLVVTDTVPGSLWLFLLVAGVVILMMTQTVRRKSRAQGNRLTAMLALPAALAVAGLFFAIPQGDYNSSVHIQKLQSVANDLLSRLPFVDQTIGGDLVISLGGQSADHLDLQRVGPKNKILTPVMELNADFSGKVYLRGRDYDIYDGTGWKASDGRIETDFLPEDRVYTQKQGQLSLRVYSKRNLRYLPYYPDTAPTLEDGRLTNPEDLTRYEYVCMGLREDWQDAWDTYAGGFPQQQGGAYLQLPAQTRERAERLLATILTDSERRNVRLAAEAIANYVNMSAEYDLKTPRMPSDATDFALWFLESSDTGYCVHFASATAVLLRAAGIPARYVEGYSADVSRGNTTIVNEGMAHAWVEYYLYGVGWMVLESTPPEPEPEETTRATRPTALPTRPTRPTAPTTVPTAPTVTTAPTTAATTAPAAQTVTVPGSGAGTASGEVPPVQKRELPAWFVKLLRAFAWSALTLVAVIGQWMLRRYWRIQRRHQGSHNQQALNRYREVKQMAWLCRIPVPDELTALAEKAKYSQYTLGRQELSRFDAFLREGVENLRERPWYYRLAARLIFAAY